MFGLDPILSTFILSGGIFLVSFMLGRWSKDATQEEIIEHTIDYLIRDGYLKAVTVDGELYLEKLNGNSEDDEAQDDS